MTPLVLEDPTDYDVDGVKSKQTVVVHEKSSSYPIYAKRTDINLILVTEAMLSGKVSILNY